MFTGTEAKPKGHKAKFLFNERRWGEEEVEAYVEGSLNVASLYTVEGRP